jgi:hypothetical protein
MSDISENSGYFSRPDGVSGMNVSALADLCAVEQPAITQILNRIRDSDPITNNLEDCLKPYAGKELRLITNDPAGGLIIVDEVCQAILEYYVFDARFYKGKDIAKDNFRAIAKAGMRFFIWSKTGYVPSELRKTEEPQSTRGTYWYKRLAVAMSSIDQPLQAGYFCTYLEMMRFFSELETRLGYVVQDVNMITDEYIIPDISIGKCFNAWLRDEDKTVCKEEARKIRKELLGSEDIIDFRDPANLKAGYRPAGKNNQELLKYKHVFPEESHGKKNVQPITSYPNKYKSIFHHYLEQYYIPQRCFPYIKERDPEGIEQLRQTIALMPDKARNALSGTLAGRFIRALLPPAQ